MYARYKYDYNEDGEWKFEYNICEFVWGFCKNPCFAKALTRQLEKNITDLNGLVKALAKGNRHIKSERLYHKWDTAMNIIDLNDNKKPLIIYSTENSHIWSDKKIKR